MDLPLHGVVSLEPYKGAPLLKRAIGVQQFSQVMKISDPSGAGIANFQDCIRAKYPEAKLDTEKLFTFTVEDGKMSHVEVDLPIWRFFDKSRKWRASLTRESVSVETREGYIDRYHFIDEMRFLIEAVEAYFAPAEASRCGARFINVKSAAEKGDLASCAPELVSITGLESIEEAALMWRFNVDEGTLLLRSGIVPPNQSHDPEILDPVEHRSWVLDIDVFRLKTADFNSAEIMAAFSQQVQRAHAIFRWAVPDQSEGV